VTLFVLLVLGAQDGAGGVNLTPILIAVIAALGGSGATAWLTISRTNQKLEAEAELIYQQALELSDKRAAANVETMERITRTLSERLTETERALEDARAKLDQAETKIRDLAAKADLIEAEKNRAVVKAEAERDALRRRVNELEERYADLIAALPGKRRNDPPPKAGH
jgi:chromosome segregation ATPase